MKPACLRSLDLVLLSAGSAFAHHNISAMFDFNQVVTQIGTLAELDWRNPHIYIYVDVDEDGAVEPWSFEGPPPASFETATSTARIRGAYRPAPHRRSEPRSQRFDVGLDLTGHARRRHGRFGPPAELLSRSRQASARCSGGARRLRREAAISVRRSPARRTPSARPRGDGRSRVAASALTPPAVEITTECIAPLLRYAPPARARRTPLAGSLAPCQLT